MTTQQGKPILLLRWKIMLFYVNNLVVRDVSCSHISQNAVGQQQNTGNQRIVLTEIVSVTYRNINQTHYMHQMSVSSRTQQMS